MTGTLVRENLAIRGLRRFLFITAAASFAAFNVVTLYVWGDKVMPLPLFVAALWLAPAIYIVFGPHSRRCSPFDLGLPISARQLWLSHLIAVIVAGIVILALAGIVVAGSALALMALANRNLLTIDQFGSLAIYFTAAFVLAAVVSQLTANTENSVRRTWPRALFSIAVVAAGYWLTLQFESAPPVVPVGMLAIAGVLAWLSFRGVPVVYDLATESSGYAVARGTAADWTDYKPIGRGVRFDWFVWRTLSRFAHARLKRSMSLWILLPMSVALGAAANIGIDDDRLLVFLFAPMLSYMLVAFATQPLSNTQLVDALPISRRTLLNVIVLPHVAALSFGYGIGLVGRDIIDAQRSEPLEDIRFAQLGDDEAHYVYIPLRFCRTGWGDNIPDAEAPWGETSQLWQRPVFKGGELKIYTPFGINADSSIEFVAWQISRATEAIYGETIPADEIADRYLTVGKNGRVLPKNDGLTIAADYPHLKAIGNGPVYPFVMGFAVAFGFLVLAHYMRSLRAGASKSQRMRAYFTALAIAMSLWVGQMVVGIANLMDPDYASVVIAGFLRGLGSSAVGVLGLWAFSLAIVAVTYRIMLSRLRHVEAPAESLDCWL